MIYPKEYIIAP